MATSPGQRARRLLVGLALGDAFGAPVEFDSPDTIVGRRAWLESFPGGGPFGWAPGEFTDDTQMALVLARHLLVHPQIEQQALVGAFAAWADRAADVGIQTRQVLRRIGAGGTWQAATELLSPEAAGNGSLMRVAPVVLVAASRNDAMDLAERQSVVTHPNEECVDACRVFVAILWDELEGHPTALVDYASLATTASIRDALRAATQNLAPPMSGYVVHTLAGALWAVSGAASYRDAVWRAVCLGHDADTVAAIAGALAALRFEGDAGIPAGWLERVTSQHPEFLGWGHEDLEGLAARLFDKRG